MNSVLRLLRNRCLFLLLFFSWQVQAKPSGSEFSLIEDTWIVPVVILAALVAAVFYKKK